MSLLDDPEIKRILDKARILSRPERESTILTEVARLGALDVLQLNLRNTFQVDTLAQVAEDDFDLAALISWKLIYKLRDSGGVVH